MRELQVAKPEPDHNLVAADMRLLGRFVPNRRKREAKGRRVIDLQHLMASPQLRGAPIERFTTLPPGTGVDGMVTTFTEAMIPTTANIAPSGNRCQGPRRWCSSQETKAEKLAVWQEREAATELLRADPGNNNLRRT